MSERQNDVKEFTQQMPYKGAAHGAETPSTGYFAGTHCHVTEQGRKAQLKDIGLETREEYIDAESGSGNAAKEITGQRMKRMFFLFVAMFILSIAVGMVVAGICNWGAKVGLVIGAGVGLILFILPMIVLIITRSIKE